MTDYNYACLDCGKEWAGYSNKRVCSKWRGGCGGKLKRLERFDSDDAELVLHITAVVREADVEFERVGGSSRHWVRDCFLPILNQSGFTITEKKK